jgi:hypothetical protein
VVFPVRHDRQIHASRASAGVSRKWFFLRRTATIPRGHRAACRSTGLFDDDPVSQILNRLGELHSKRGTVRSCLQPEAKFNRH